MTPKHYGINHGPTWLAERSRRDQEGDERSRRFKARWEVWRLQMRMAAAHQGYCPIPPMPRYEDD